MERPQLNSMLDCTLSYRLYMERPEFRSKLLTFVSFPSNDELVWIQTSWMSAYKEIEWNKIQRFGIAMIEMESLPPFKTNGALSCLSCSLPKDAQKLRSSTFADRIKSRITLSLTRTDFLFQTSEVFRMERDTHGLHQQFLYLISFHEMEKKEFVQPRAWMTWCCTRSGCH